MYYIPLVSYEMKWDMETSIFLKKVYTLSGLWE